MGLTDRGRKIRGSLIVLLLIVAASLLSACFTGGSGAGSLSDGREGADAAASAPLMLSAQQQNAVELGGTFRELFDRTDLPNRFPILIWLLVVELAGLAAMPLAFLLLPGLRDRGCFFAKQLGILLIAWLGWIAVSLGIAVNDRGTSFLAASVVVAAGVLVFALRRGEILAFFRGRLGLLLASEAIFWLAFAAFLAIRVANPDLWHPARGGEKPMDLAYLMATLKSATFPPYDPWFAGGYLNYYYFGQVIVASVVKLTGILPTTAYNLAVPLLFGLTVNGAFSTGYNLAYRLVPSRRQPHFDISSRHIAPALSGALAAIFVGVLGNLGGAIQVVYQLYLTGERLLSGDLGLTRAVVPLIGLWQVVAGAQPFEIPSDWYWHSTRIIPGTINEFPFFTFLYADLHAHLIALPLTLLAITVALSLVRQDNTGTVVGSVGRGDAVGEADPVERLCDSPGTVESKDPTLPRQLPTLLLAGLVLGGLFTSNSWDFPTYSLIVAGALALPAVSRRPTLRRAILSTTKIALVLATAYVLYLPFHLSFQSFYTGVEPFSDKSQLGHYVAVHGLFLFVLVSFLVSELLARREKTLRVLGILTKWRRKARRAIRLLGTLGKGSAAEWYGPLFEIAFLGGLLVALYQAGQQLVAVLLALSACTLLCLSRSESAHKHFLFILLGVGLALSIVVEFLAIKGDVGRMNTVFKFYLQIWLLWSLAAAAALPLLWSRLRLSVHKALRKAWLGFLVLFLLAAAVYPLAATRARTEDRLDRSVPLTLDGTAYMRSALYHDQDRAIPLVGDLEAIEWLQDHVAGSPVILEAQVPIYRWGSRISIYTGLPTVLGWDWHQKQQRWDYRSLVDQRVADVGAMYNSPSIQERVALLAHYRVRYVYVGGLERAYYAAPSLDIFDTMVGNFLEIVYDSGGTKIYRVKG